MADDQTDFDEALLDELLGSDWRDTWGQVHAPVSQVMQAIPIFGPIVSPLSDLLYSGVTGRPTGVTKGFMPSAADQAAQKAAREADLAHSFESPGVRAARLKRESDAAASKAASSALSTSKDAKKSSTSTLDWILLGGGIAIGLLALVVVTRAS